MTELTKHDQIIQKHWQQYLDFTLNQTKVFENYHLDLYDEKCAMITAQYENKGDDFVKTQIAEYHRNFIKDHCYINIGNL